MSLDETIDNNSEIKNGLENFELSEETPQLFTTDREIDQDANEKSFINESEEDELEIPAFLRRQKN